MTNVWVIRSHYGKHTRHFVDGGYVGAGWLREDDLSKVKTKDELTAMYRQAHPDQSPWVVGAIVGQLWLFLEMGVGDYVITPGSDSQWLYYGRVVDAPYYYAPNHLDGCDFPHRRPVAWAGKRINRSEFSDTFQNTLKFTQKTAFRFNQHEELLDKVVQGVTTPKYSIAEVSDRGKKIYADQIKALVEPLENGKFIVIDIESGEYEVDEKMLVASRRLRERRPDSVPFGARVGHNSAYRINDMSSGTSRWEQYDFHGKVVGILRNRPGEFLTAYQLAIEFEHTLNRGVDYPDWAVGGEGLGMHSSLSQYLALELSQRIGSSEITEIEVSRLSHLHMTRLAFDNNGVEIRASTVSSRTNQTIFRHR